MSFVLWAFQVYMKKFWKGVKVGTLNVIFHVFYGFIPLFSPLLLSSVFRLLLLTLPLVTSPDLFILLARQNRLDSSIITQLFALSSSDFDNAIRKSSLSIGNVLGMKIHNISHKSRNMMEYDIIWYDMIWYDMKRCDWIWLNGFTLPISTPVSATASEMSAELRLEVSQRIRSTAKPLDR